MTTAVRTGGPGQGGISLLVVEKGTPGFAVDRSLSKLGWHCSDTAELGFADVRVPAGNLVGAENTGFVVQINTTSTLDITLQAGDVKETLTVTASSPVGAGGSNRNRTRARTPGLASARVTVPSDACGTCASRQGRRL